MDSGYWVAGICMILIALILLPLLRNAESETLSDEVRSHSQGAFIRLSQGYTHYEVSGPKNGAVVVLIHGFSVPLYMWDPTFQSLSKAGFRVIRYDLYGRGLSDRPRLRYDRTLFVDQLKELLDALGIGEPVHLAGTSMGGAVATAFAVCYPERIRKVVLIDPLSKKRKIGILAWPGLGEYIAKSFYIPLAPRKQLQDFADPNSFPEWPVRFREQMRYRGFSRALLSTTRHFMNQEHILDYQMLGQYRKKVLLLWGMSDRMFGMDEADKLGDILGVEIVWVEKAGHIPHYERPEVVNPLIIRFLNE